MDKITRLPALPIIACDPYFSIWSPFDRITDGDTTHWSGAPKPFKGILTIDGKPYRFLGSGLTKEMETVSQTVSATATTVILMAGGVQLKIIFRNAAIPDDPDLFSVPVTIFEYTVASTDGSEHDVTIELDVPSSLVYDGAEIPELCYGTFPSGEKKMTWMGQRQQKLLYRSGDHITIDWGYLFVLSSNPPVTDEKGLHFCYSFNVSEKTVNDHLLIGYDDVASILYFGTPCKAWYARNGKTLPQAMNEIETNYISINKRCDALDKTILSKADIIGGDTYCTITNAAWRLTFAAHKLIATPKGEMALLSKENDSNGCIGTVDVAYPACPLFLKYNPSLVNALCRPVLEFASMPVWEYDFAPHDVGRYPIVNGQVYSCAKRHEYAWHENVFPPFYLFPAGCDTYCYQNQMPVEECGNMLIMMCMAAEQSGNYSLISEYRLLLEKWVKYLLEFGEDPGEQLCTDDFAGHLAHNINLSAKAIVGIALWGRALNKMGFSGEELTQKAKTMAQSWYQRAKTSEGTALTFGGQGWSMKYNTVWDKILHLNLFPKEFYDKEIKLYLQHVNHFGLPLDSREDYTKSDWTMWVACLASEKKDFISLIKPIETFLKETESRVPFSDWYYTTSGKFHHFIARPVQGGLFMPFLL